jgi:hypothetical protein
LSNSCKGRHFWGVSISETATAGAALVVSISRRAEGEADVSRAAAVGGKFGGEYLQ